MADTELQQLVVWVGTTEKIEQARAQGLITENDFAITTDAPEFQTKLTSANAGTGISITEVGGVVKISNTQTSAEWGNILGNLPDQADLWGYLSDILSDISDIKSLIPTQASSSNQLADKAFVNSTTQTATANFRGNWATWADIPTNAEEYPLDYAQSRTPTVNDYLVVQDASGYTGETLEGTWRFKYSGEWSVNGKNGWHPEYQVNETPLTAAQLAALNSGATEAKINQITTNQNAIGTLASLTTTEKNNLVGAINELDSTKQDNINDLATIRSGAAAGATAVQPGQLGTAAYQPTTAFATAAQGTKADTAVQPSQLGTAAYENANSFATAAQGAKADTALQPNDNISELNNDAGFITLSALSDYQLKSTIQTLSATDSITLADNTIYNGGEQTSLTIALPATDTVGFICDVDFSSGNTATTLSYSLPDIFWAGTDVAYDATAQKDIFTPVANKRYTIVFYYDGVNYNGRVGGV